MENKSCADCGFKQTWLGDTINSVPKNQRLIAFKSLCNYGT